MKEGFACATDGTRIHKIPVSENLDDGLWEVIKKSASEIILGKLDNDAGTYPNINRVYPTVFTEKTLSIYISTGRAWLSKDALHLFTINNEGLPINPDYLKDLKGFPWKVRFPSDQAPLLFTCDDGKEALIMPLRREV